MNSCDSVETTTSTRAVCNTATSDVHNQSASDKAVPLMTSTLSVMIGNADRAAADAVVMAPAEAHGMQRAVLVSGRQQISLTGDGSVVLTVSCSPLTVDRPSVCSAATQSTHSDVQPPSQDTVVVTVTESTPSRRFVDCICICWVALDFCPPHHFWAPFVKRFALCYQSVVSLSVCL